MSLVKKKNLQIIPKTQIIVTLRGTNYNTEICPWAGNKKQRRSRTAHYTKYGLMIHIKIITRT